MAAPSLTPQQRLAAYWLAAAPGTLCAWEQAKALAYREASKELHNGKVKLAWVASKLTKQGGGSPQKGSLSEFFSKLDADPQWFHGNARRCETGPAARPDSSLAAMHCAVSDACQGTG